jgi:hypothetical protein
VAQPGAEAGQSAKLARPSWIIPVAWSRVAAFDERAVEVLSAHSAASHPPGAEGNGEAQPVDRDGSRTDRPVK